MRVQPSLSWEETSRKQQQNSEQNTQNQHESTAIFILWGMLWSWQFLDDIFVDTAIWGLSAGRFSDRENFMAAFKGKHQAKQLFQIDHSYEMRLTTHNGQ